MPSLRIRNLPDAVYRRLAEQARRERRTLSHEAAILLAQALDASPLPKERRRGVLAGLSERPLVEKATDIPPPELLLRNDRLR